MTAENYLLEPHVQHAYVGARRAERFLPFLLPHLRPGLSLLDCGCGVGALTADLATAVAPGRVVGLDADESQLTLARALAAERGLRNVEFVRGSVYGLPFSNAAFDVVVANAVLVHLADPLRALMEMRRMVAAGGIATVADDDHDTLVFSPDLPELQLALDLFVRALRHHGGSPTYARHLRSLMLRAGFARAEGLAHAPESYGTEQDTAWFADFLADLFASPTLTELIVGEGWATRAQLAELVPALRTWGRQPDAFIAWLYCAALGRTEPGRASAAATRVPLATATSTPL